MNIRLVDDVYDDLRTSRDWYDRKCDGLGEESVELFFHVVNGLSHRTVHASVDETRLPTKQISGHEVWNMTAKGTSAEITQAMIRHDGAVYKLMAVTFGGNLDAVAVSRFVDSLSIVQPSSTNVEATRPTDGQPVKDFGGGVDFHHLSKNIGGAGALLGIGLLVYFLNRGKKNRQK